MRPEDEWQREGVANRLQKRAEAAEAKLKALQEAVTEFLSDFQVPPPDKAEKWADYIDLRNALAKSKE